MTILGSEQFVFGDRWATLRHSFECADLFFKLHHKACGVLY
jgi:hypothetical protein